jgi:hypothetical protein
LQVKREAVHEPSDIATTVVMVVDDVTEVIVGRVDARTPDLALVDALVRLQLDARRSGWRICLRDVPQELIGLLQLVGLAGVLAVETGREPELGEQLGKEEVVQPGDLPA